MVKQKRSLCDGSTLHAPRQPPPALTGCAGHRFRAAAPHWPEQQVGRAAHGLRWAWACCSTSAAAPSQAPAFNRLGWAARAPVQHPAGGEQHQAPLQRSACLGSRSMCGAQAAARPGKGGGADASASAAPRVVSRPLFSGPGPSSPPLLGWQRLALWTTWEGGTSTGGPVTGYSRSWPPQWRCQLGSLRYSMAVRRRASTPSSLSAWMGKQPPLPGPRDLSGCTASLGPGLLSSARQSAVHASAQVHRSRAGACLRWPAASWSAPPAAAGTGTG